jgi:hypothetical protein
MTLIPIKADQVEQYQNTDGMKFESVDQIVISGINSIESTNLDKNLLRIMYDNL